MEVKTSDIYLSAYLVSHQIHPKNVQKLGTNRKVMFVFPNTKTALELVDNYNSGKATTNVTQYRNHLEYVRDLIFATLRSAK